MPDQVPEAVKKERSEKLLALGHRMSEEFRRYYLGRQVTALLEEEFYMMESVTTPGTQKSM